MKAGGRQAAIFSAQKFPGSDFKLEWRREESGRNWYYNDEFTLEGWLCPELLKFSPALRERFTSKSSTGAERNNRSA
jgi:hypothetical protein